MTEAEQAVIDAAGGWRTDMENAPTGYPVWVVWDMEKYAFADEPELGVRHDDGGWWIAGQYTAQDSDLIAWSDAKKPRFTDWHLARLATQEKDHE